MDLNCSVKKLEFLGLQGGRADVQGCTEKCQLNDSSMHWLSGIAGQRVRSVQKRKNLNATIDGQDASENEQDTRKMTIVTV
jgi:hypothetical protein